MDVLRGENSLELCNFSYSNNIKKKKKKRKKTENDVFTYQLTFKTFEFDNIHTFFWMNCVLNPKY